MKYNTIEMEAAEALKAMKAEMEAAEARIERGGDNTINEEKTMENQNTKNRTGITEAIEEAEHRPALEHNPAKPLSGAEAAGAVFGGVSNANTLYGQEMFNTPRGHGFAAEQANHLYDKLTMKDAKIVGGDNARWGADRIVDGVAIQTKYCNSGSKCIQACFSNGEFKYFNADGSPMQVEVPSDMFESSVKAMEARIERGEVKGVTDKARARDIVKEGRFSYRQARNIAKFGTVESITFHGRFIKSGK